MTKTLAWPLTAAWAVWRFKTPLERLLALLTKVKYGEFELEFGAKVAALDERANKTLPAPGPEAHVMKLQAVTMSPRALVMETAVRVEAALNQAVQRVSPDVLAGLKTGRPLNPAKMVQVLKDRGLLSDEQANILWDLFALRNSAAHAPNFEPGSQSLERYADTGDRLVALLAGIAPRKT